MSADKKYEKLNLAEIFAPLAEEIAITQNGPRVQITIDLAESLCLNETFLASIDKHRKIAYKKEEMINDPGLKIEEYKDFNFEYDCYFEDPEIIIYEDKKTPLNKYVFKVLNEFKLPPNFYFWIFNWINYGKKPYFLPKYDFEILAKINFYLKSKSGITNYEKDNLLAWLRRFFKAKIIDDKECANYRKLVSLIPKNVYRKKRVLEEVKKYTKEIKKVENHFETTEGKTTTKNTSKNIANDILDAESGSINFDDRKASKLASKLRMRLSRYKN